MQGKIDRALKSLGIKNFLFGIHDAAFPSFSEEDFGRGTPYSEGAADFMGFVRSLGFSGIQLGPQGITTEANTSPYDGSLFSRNPLSLAMRSLTRMECPLLNTGKYNQDFEPTFCRLHTGGQCLRLGGHREYCR